MIEPKLTEPELTINGFADLFEIYARGMAAASFMHANKNPNTYWSKLFGEEELTLRDMGEISHETGCDLRVHFISREQVGKTND